MVSPLYLRELIVNFLNEDLGVAGDWSSLPLRGMRAKGVVVAKEDGILCGAPFFSELFRLLSGELKLSWLKEEGQEFSAGEVLCEVECDASALLQGERTALNILQRLSGIATNTRKFVEALRGSRVKLLDTRKTTPGLRALEKYASKVGGAVNHRFGLYDAVMVKDNHIALFGGIGRAVEEIRRLSPATLKLEVEVESWEQLEELLGVIGLVDIVMLDNWELSQVPEAVEVIRTKDRRVKVELSGGIGYEELKLVSRLPVDFVSTSKTITAARWIDISMEVCKVDGYERP
jgi:nicotinate-nucleotide pyrophosphorylase (carboxylating)